MDNRPIGVFDSGFGGLTIAKEIMDHLTNERIVYFGDTARIPYGSKSKETIIKYSAQIIRFLQTKDVKAIVIACGTASATALEAVREKFDLPIIGVVEPAAMSAVKETKNNRIGIIGTDGTIASKSYDQVIYKQTKNIDVFSTACPLFVPLVEEGWLEDEVTVEVAKRYLKTLKDKDVDTLILGCTHYPLLSKIIGEIMGDVTLINPANETAAVLDKLLTSKDLKHDDHEPIHEFYVSDRANKFEAFAKIILQRQTLHVQHINIENY
ncbi:MAG: glutamate racemase [Firmicutes bacterium HGW-Firmicutes-1]|jgi:glutamate racemase|nr:MAG: glutamate racemase [Firmicutes bacterium HGW-Firmicutes-1]